MQILKVLKFHFKYLICSIDAQANGMRTKTAPEKSKLWKFV